MVVLAYTMLYTKFRPSERKIFRYYIWAWQPYCARDQNRLNYISFPKPREATYESWIWLAQWFQRRSHLKVWAVGRRRNLAILKARNLRLSWAKKRHYARWHDLSSVAQIRVFRAFHASCSVCQKLCFQPSFLVSSVSHNDIPFNR